MEIKIQIENKIKKLEDKINTLQPCIIENELQSLEKIIIENKNHLTNSEINKYKNQIEKLRKKINKNLSILDNYILTAVDSLENLRRQNRRVENIKNRIKNSFNSINNSQHTINDIGHRYSKDRNILYIGVFIIILIIIFFKYFL